MNRRGGEKDEKDKQKRGEKDEKHEQKREGEG